MADALARCDTPTPLAPYTYANREERIQDENSAWGVNLCHLITTSEVAQTRQRTPSCSYLRFMCVLLVSMARGANGARGLARGRASAVRLACNQYATIQKISRLLCVTLPREKGVN